MRGWRASWWVLLGLLACSESHGAATEGEGEAPVVDGAFLRARCQHQARCDPAGLSAYPGSDVEGCVMLWGCILPGLVPDGCAEAVANAPCEPWAVDDALASDACRNDTTAPVHAESGREEGALCLGNDCAEGLACNYGLAEPLFCGVCVPGGEAAVGESCAGAFRCSRRAFCNGDDVCEARRVDGEPCDAGSRCVSRFCGQDGRCYTPGPEDPCDSFRECLSGLLCRDGICAPPPDLGEPCDAGELFDFGEGISGRGCKPPLLCVDGRCETGGCITRVGVGEPCGTLVQCELGRAVCSFRDGRCRELPAAGEPCDLEAREHHGIACRDGYCDADTERCVARAPVGAPCEDSAQCESGMCFDGGCLSTGFRAFLDDCRAL